jgi:poly(3-hydroxybutyrate) depolymerase
MNFLYQLNELKKAGLLPTRKLAEATSIFLNKVGSEKNTVSNLLNASNEMMKRLSVKNTRPDFNIHSVVCDINGLKTNVDVTENILLSKPFCNLLHFQKTSSKLNNQPKMLIVAPLSGHFATLLKDTVSACLQNFDVYVTDWIDSRLVPLKDGDFALDDYVDYILDFMRYLGTGVNVLAVCQPAVPVLIATALLEEYNEPCMPESIILMGGPIDTRINPGKVDDFAKLHNMKWFERNVINTVPAYYAGANRKVCPGFIMLNGFMFLNIDRHQDASFNFFENLLAGDDEKVDKHQKFYDEYRAVMDVPAQYFLDSIRYVFQEHALPLGKMKWRNHLINPAKIKNAKLFTIEGELDDISCPGQTEAAHAICSSISDKNRKHYLQLGAGHYGIFSGSKWRQSIYPKIVDFCGAW